MTRKALKWLDVWSLPLRLVSFHPTQRCSSQDKSSPYTSVLPDRSSRLQHKESSCGDQSHKCVVSTYHFISTGSPRQKKPMWWTQGIPPPNHVMSCLLVKSTLTNAKVCRSNHLIIARTIKAWYHAMISIITVCQTRLGWGFGDDVPALFALSTDASYSLFHSKKL